MGENFHPQSSEFPDKPIFEKDGNTLRKSIISAVLFIVAFYFFFDQDIKVVLILVVVLFIHEMGHLLAMKYFNYSDLKIFFIPMLGAIAMGNKEDVSQRQRCIILLAGPIPGIVIGLVLYAVGLSTGNADVIKSANIFIFLNIFNLLPFTPLDGGNLMETLFFERKEILQKIFAFISIIGLAGIAFYLKSYFLLIIPFFMAIRFSQQGKTKKVKAALDQEGLNYNQPYESLSNQEYWEIRDQVLNHVGAFKDASPGDYHEAPGEKQIVNYIKGLSVRKPIADLRGVSKTFIMFVWILFLIGPVVFAAFMSRSDLFEEQTKMSFKKQFMAECMETSDKAENISEGFKHYCECISDSIVHDLTIKEIKGIRDMDAKELKELFQPYIQTCMLELNRTLPADSTELEN